MRARPHISETNSCPRTCLGHDGGGDKAAVVSCLARFMATAGDGRSKRGTPLSFYPFLPALSISLSPPRTIIMPPLPIPSPFHICYCYLPIPRPFHTPTYVLSLLFLLLFHLLSFHVPSHTWWSYLASLPPIHMFLFISPAPIYAFPAAIAFPFQIPVKTTQRRPVPRSPRPVGVRPAPPQPRQR